MLKFKGSWRSYQQRILRNLEFHLLDKKLHIVAAPGAGKTTLGIEVLSRLNRTALILCPTNTIKNQWRDRICSAFLNKDEYDNVSTDIRKPALLTIVTYQALLAAFCEGSAGKEENILEQDNTYDIEEESDNESITSSKRFKPEKADEIIKILKKANVSLLCFDEAHHLRKEWWKALTYLVDELKPKQTVALTATPPYDVEYAEWERYEELCGPIDEVISIPELVQNGDLCPHQDFIYFSLLRDNESAVIREYNTHVGEFLGKIFKDSELFLYLSKMSFLNPTENDIEKIFDAPDFYVSIASFLKSGGVEIPKKFLELFDAKQTEIPPFGIEQAKDFINGFLTTHTNEFPGLEEKIESYNNLAKRLGLIQNKRIVLNDSQKIQKQIAHSLGKLDSIVEIADLETKNLGKDLRMVVLADYIKENDSDNAHLGVVPIWRTLKNKFKSSVSLGVLCGSLIILPKQFEKVFIELLSKASLALESVTISPHKEDGDYIKITPKNSAKHHIVGIITEMFNLGYINILIGTQALLGEGWDAPCINSLILSGTVSSYMLSNQMRGRAIRKDKNNPDKISNIWHLASVRIPKLSDIQGNVLFKETVSDYDFDMQNSELYDLNQLSKRFEGFEAPSYYGNHEILSGIDRIISDKFNEQAKILGERAFTYLNKQTVILAQNRKQTKKWWTDSLCNGYNGGTVSMNVGVNTPYMTARTLMFTGFKQIIMSVVMCFGAVLAFLFISGLFAIWAIFAIWLVAFISAMIWLGIKYLRTGSPEGIMRQIAIVHLETLAYMGHIKTSLNNIGIKVQNTDYLFLSCKNLPIEENNLLIKSVQEFLDPIENPRYILIKKNFLLKTFKQTDYFAIPSIISSKKQNVEIFKSLWEKYIGKCDIAYTRNLEGRKLLLKARKNAFSSSKREKSKKISKWG